MAILNIRKMRMDHFRMGCVIPKIVSFYSKKVCFFTNINVATERGDFFRKNFFPPVSVSFPEKNFLRRNYLFSSHKSLFPRHLRFIRGRIRIMDIRQNSLESYINYEELKIREISSFSNEVVVNEDSDNEKLPDGKIWKIFIEENCFVKMTYFTRSDILDCLEKWKNLE
jgi:hypothetical protein